MIEKASKSPRLNLPRIVVFLLVVGVQHFASGSQPVTNSHFKCTSGLLYSDGVLFGTSETGGTYGRGAVFKYSLTTAQFSVLHSFNKKDGLGPRHRLTQVDTSIIAGITPLGGRANGGSLFLIENGVFRRIKNRKSLGQPFGYKFLGGKFYLANQKALLAVSMDGAVKTIRRFPKRDDLSGHLFVRQGALCFISVTYDRNLQPSNRLNILDATSGSIQQAFFPGVYPHAFTVGADEGIYYMEGFPYPVGGVGAVRQGTSEAFSFQPSSIRLGYSQAKGMTAVGSVIYGVTPSGVTTRGTLFQYTPGVGPFVLYGFSDSEIGSNPVGDLTLAEDGSLVGTTREGAALGNGAIFRYRPDIGMGLITPLPVTLPPP